MTESRRFNERQAFEVILCWEIESLAYIIVKSGDIK